MGNTSQHFYFTIFYTIFFIATFFIRSRIRQNTLKNKKVMGKIKAKWTSKYIFYVYIILVFGSLLEFFIIKKEINFFISILGILFYIISLIGRQWAYNSLGPYWSIDIEIRKEHPILRKGPYKFIRQPNTIVHLMEVAGITMIPNAYYMFYLFVIGYLPIMLLRAFIEEKEMGKAIGKKYKVYQQNTGMFLPRIL